MRIVEYNDSYAAGVAEMWNRSRESWGNDESVKTADDVINTESNAGNLKLYLAIDNDEVVGYCSFSEYKQDEGASYLPLLNVRPDYHGKKVGKALILQVIEDAKKSKWPRFDLYTWSGNIKAMPLYKKCGFFWERKNNSVHLMNFLPYLCQSPLLDEYLDKVDLYKDSVREITMEHDGDAKRGSEYFRYDFKNEQTELAFEFEKTGRGLTYIDTPDFEIEVSIEKHEYVYGKEYPVFYSLKNKTNKPLSIKLQGQNNKNISFNYEHVIDLKDEMTLESTFKVGKIVKDQEKWRTYPVVETVLYVNGKEVTLKVGLEAKHPINLKMFVPKFNHLPGKTYDLYLDIENNLTTTETFEISLEETEFVLFPEKAQISLDPKQKKGIKVPYVLKGYGFYNQDAIVSYGEETFNKNVTGIFKGATSSFTGEDEHNAYILSGNSMVFFNKAGKTLGIMNQPADRPKTAFFAPQLGLPYSLEFSNIEPKIEFTTNNDMIVTFDSEAFKGIKVLLHINNTFGVMSLSYELLNELNDRTVSFTTFAWPNLKDAMIPLEGKILDVKGIDGADLDYIDFTKHDENWLYCESDRVGFTWDDSMTCKLAQWRLSYEVKDITLKKGESFRTGNFRISTIHPNLKEFRHFAGYDETRELMNFFELDVNNGNPFSNTDVDVRLKSNKKVELVGTLSHDKVTVDVNDKLTVKTGLQKYQFEIKDRICDVTKMVFKTSGEVQTIIEEDSFIVDNGVIKYKASNDYADSIYSLMFDGHEWLDSNYPEPKEKAWWADFVGGITTRVNGIQDNSSLLEKRTTSFVEVKDNYDQTWTGIKYAMVVEKDPDLKGLELHTYAVTLPGVPVLNIFTKIVNKTGKYIGRKEFYRYHNYLAPDTTQEMYCEQDGNKYKLGDVMVEVLQKKYLEIYGTRKHRIGIYNKDLDLLVDSQKQYTMLYTEDTFEIPDGDTKHMSGDYIIFTDKPLNKEILKDLENLRFEVANEDN